MIPKYFKQCYQDGKKMLHTSLWLLQFKVHWHWKKYYEDVRGIYALNINLGDSELLREDVEPFTLSWSFNAKKNGKTALAQSRK